jgi:hypothetical protein
MTALWSTRSFWSPRPKSRRAIRHIYWHERQIVEGSPAVGVAALLAGKVAPGGPGGHGSERRQHRHGAASPGSSPARMSMSRWRARLMGDIKILTEADLRRLVTLDLEAVDCVEQAFARWPGARW